MASSCLRTLAVTANHVAVPLSLPDTTNSRHVARASLSSCCSSRSWSLSSLSFSDSSRSSCAASCAVSCAAARPHPARFSPALPLADERKPLFPHATASTAQPARADVLLRPLSPLTSLPLSPSSPTPLLCLSSSFASSSRALRPARGPITSRRPLSALAVRASASDGGSFRDGESGNGGSSSGGSRGGAGGSSEWASGEREEEGERDAVKNGEGEGEAEEMDEAERERQEELLRALGLDSSIPETANEFLDKVSSRAYEMRRRLESTMDSTSYDVVDSNPWRDPAKPLFVLAQGDTQLYTMRTRTPRSEVESELDKLFGEKRAKKGGVSTGATGKSGSSSGNTGGGTGGSSGRSGSRGGGSSSSSRTASPTRSRFAMKVEDVREGVLVFEDEQQAAQYCSVLEGQGHNCLGVAQFKAKDLFKVCQSSKALAVLFRSGVVPPQPDRLQQHLGAKKRSLEDDV
ncbi:hypothetical protein CLOM_g4502 [Closterium sp. NIES-68]|nr:hypothetical protein CLOM_g4502 [Closterium sp. NIES-68]GJP80853.1 hypothetical protein CLOP_g11052 [Closterium sp. NIES-67]